MIAREANSVVGVSRCFRFLALGVSLTLFLWPAQAQTYQTWPEIDTYKNLNQNFRLYFIAAQTIENREKDAEIGPNLDFFFKPLFKKNRSVIFQPDPSKARPFVLRVGYRYLPSTNGPTQHRCVLEATGRYALKSGFLFSIRNRADLRFIKDEFSWRYRNAPTVERTVSIGSYHFTPYAGGEVFFDSSDGKWSITSETVGVAFPIRKHTELQPYYEHQNDTSKPPNHQINAVGISLNLYF